MAYFIDFGAIKQVITQIIRANGLSYSQAVKLLESVTENLAETPLSIEIGCQTWYKVDETGKVSMR